VISSEPVFCFTKRNGGNILSTTPKFYDAPIQPIEVLGLIPAKVRGVNSVAIVIRSDPTMSYRSQTISVTKEQAVRLSTDIQHMLTLENPVWE
jgi:hypothetical protein